MRLKSSINIQRLTKMSFKYMALHGFKTYPYISQPLHEVVRNSDEKWNPKAKI